MADKIENKNPQNYDELTENQIFEKIKEDLTPIQESLSKTRSNAGSSDQNSPYSWALWPTSGVQWYRRPWEFQSRECEE